MRGVCIRAIVVLAVSSVGCTEREATVSADSAHDVYQRACARCHGREGKGSARSTLDGPAPRDFTDAAWQNAYSDAEIRATVSSGKGPMPAFGDALSSDQIDAAVRAVREFGDLE